MLKYIIGVGESILDWRVVFFSIFLFGFISLIINLHKELNFINNIEKIKEKYGKTEKPIDLVINYYIDNLTKFISVTFIFLSSCYYIIKPYLDKNIDYNKYIMIFSAILLYNIIFYIILHLILKCKREIKYNKLSLIEKGEKNHE